MNTGPKFDADGFYKALATTVLVRKLTWKQVSQETGVSQTTLTRMSTGRKPDAASLAVLATWAGLNLANFTRLTGASPKAEPLVMATAALRNDPNLTESVKGALETVLLSTYEALKAK